VARELDYRLIKEMWAFTGNRIAVRSAYEWHDDSVTGIAPMAMRTEFSDDGLMASRFASINDNHISESDRKYHWVPGRRPEGHPGLSDFWILELSYTGDPSLCNQRSIYVR
jgi:uncharacterized protein